MNGGHHNGEQDDAEYENRPRPEGTGPDAGEGGDEDALRRMLRESVDGIEPSPTSLENLKRAVPARRAQRRQALVGAAAAVVLGCVGVPLLAQAGFVPGVGEGDHPVNAGSSHPQTEVTGGHGDGQPHEGKQSSGKGDGEQGGGEQEREDDASPSPSAGKSGGADDPNETLGVSSPDCGRDQLGGGTAQSGPPNGQGQVYGSFSVRNTSGETCTVHGQGVVTALEAGRSDTSRIKIVDHTPGDAAAGLPDPTTAPESLVLRAGESYTVKFAWIPDGCPDGGPTTKPGDAQDGGDNPSTGGDSGGTGGEGDPGTGGDGDDGTGGGGSTGGDAGEGPSGVTLLHTPEVGEPAAAETRLDGACSGTVYRTGVLPAG
ncbi:hypothetical protein [Streptomyces sp. HNM0574]|uniref:hypothetical protein n=1 Tax=Streptomyces sp. HNM0574 TaxID=2714954 RepID=UPI00146EA05A|nr:hypothetical protein [Streptomyces sp. HNM0574]NLU67850.1 hypothetical protein [Streptomyces sp. HNM0574]